MVKDYFTDFKALQTRICQIEVGPDTTICREMMDMIAEKEVDMMPGVKYKDLYYPKYPFTQSFMSETVDLMPPPRDPAHEMYNQWIAKNGNTMQNNTVIPIIGNIYHTFENLYKSRVEDILAGGITKDDMEKYGKIPVILDSTRTQFVFFDRPSMQDSPTKEMFITTIKDSRKDPFPMLTMVVPRNACRLVHHTFDDFYIEDMDILSVALDPKLYRAMDDRDINLEDMAFICLGYVYTYKDLANDPYLLNLPYFIHHTDAVDRLASQLKRNNTIIAPLPFNPDLDIKEKSKNDQK